MSKRKEDPRERRYYPRIKSLNLLSYIQEEKGVQRCGASMARTIDISQSGATVEVYQHIKPDSSLKMEIAVKELIFPVWGKVIHSQYLPNKNYVIGIMFSKLERELLNQLS